MNLNTRIIQLNSRKSLTFKAAGLILLVILLINLYYKFCGVKLGGDSEIFNFAVVSVYIKVIVGYFIAIILAPVIETLMIQRFLYFIIKEKLRLSSTAFIITSAILFGLFNFSFGWYFLPFAIIPEIIYGYIYSTLKESDQADKAFITVIYIHSVVYFCLITFNLLFR